MWRPVITLCSGVVSISAWEDPGLLEEVMKALGREGLFLNCVIVSVVLGTTADAQYVTAEYCIWSFREDLRASEEVLVKHFRSTSRWLRKFPGMKDDALFGVTEDDHFVPPVIETLSRPTSLKNYASQIQKDVGSYFQKRFESLKYLDACLEEARSHGEQCTNDSDK
jgi:hypothetical protein